MSQDIQNRVAEMLEGLMESPEAYVHDIDWQKGTALVVEADQAFYRDAVFLDNRILGTVKIGAQVPLGRLLQEIDKTKPRPRQCRFIFHCGHAGSTLVSRLLDDLPGIMGLREPLLLRYLSIIRNDVRSGTLPGGQEALELNLKRIYRLLSRTYPTHPTVIIKATSICNNFSSRLLGMHVENRAIGLYVGLVTMLANMLMKDQIGDIKGFAHTRLQGLKAQLKGFPVTLDGLTPAQLITVSWMAEIFEMYLTSTGPEANKISFINFDEFLQDTNQGIKNVLAGLALSDNPEIVERLQSSAVFTSYAKQPGFKYQATDRAANLAEAKQKYKVEIASGLEYAEQLAKKFPELQDAFERFGA